MNKTTPPLIIIICLVLFLAVNRALWLVWRVAKMIVLLEVCELVEIFQIPQGGTATLAKQ